MSDSAEAATGLGSAGDRDPDRPDRAGRGSGRSGSQRTDTERRGSAPARALRAVLVFYRQVVAELRKVIWPTRRELLTYTAVVLVFVLFMVAVVALFDFGASQAVLQVFGDG